MQTSTEFQKTIFGAHLKMPWAIRLLRALKFVTEHPECRSEVGLIPSSTCSFFVNSDVFARFLGVKRNSLNRDLQQHGFVRELCSEDPTLGPVSRHWTKRTFKYGSFNAQCTEEETGQASNHAKQHRMRIVPVESNSTPSNDIETFVVESFADGVDFYADYFEDL
jgi:hypothetical protein